MFPPLILASTSSYRRELLSRLGVPFQAVSPNVPEAHLEGEAPLSRARRLSLAKAQAVAARHPESVVIGSDQVASCGGVVLDKPYDLDGAQAQLAILSGQAALFHTGCALVLPQGDELVHVDTTTVVLRVLETADIGRYLAREQPFDCAGSFKVEGAGIALFERIESVDPTALIGLPLIWLAGALRRAGYRVP